LASGITANVKSREERRKEEIRKKSWFSLKNTFRFFRAASGRLKVQGYENMLDGLTIIFKLQEVES